jgi:hypothetical protein
MLDRIRAGFVCSQDQRLRLLAPQPSQRTKFLHLIARHAEVTGIVRQYQFGLHRHLLAGYDVRMVPR